MALERLQQDLQRIYELNVGYRVDDFLFSDPDLAGQLDAGTAFRDAREKLLVMEDEEGLNLSLFLDESVLRTLGRARTPGAVAGADMEDFCLAMEGVSHFLYLTWYAHHGRAVTLLEMELQAEIDKFVLLREFLGDEDGTAEALLERLFRQVAWQPTLGRDELDRYRLASRCAETYCRRLERTYFSTGNRGELLNELRRFYRLPREDKLRRIGVSY